MIRRAVLVLLGALGVAFLLAAPAAAHATVVSSSPADGTRLTAAPGVVTLTFDENVGLGGVGFLHVTNDSGARVDAGTAYHPGGSGAKVADRLRGGLGDGAYTASFRVVSADSHPVAGTIRFVVGSGALVRGSVAASASLGGTGQAFALIRWVSYGGIALLGGAWLLLTVWSAGRDDRRARRTVWTGWGLSTGAAVLELLVQGPYSAGAGVSRLFDPAFLDATLHSGYGLEHCVRLILLGVLAIVLGRTLQPGARLGAAPAVAGLLALGIVATFSFSGHAATTSPTWISVPTDALHIAAMAAWLGGLVLLVVAVLPRGEPAELRDVLPVFSRVAFASVVALAVTGTYAAWRGVGTIDALRTSYGLLVLGKIAVFLGLVALGNVSRRAVQRRALAVVAAPARSDVLVGAGGAGPVSADVSSAQRGAGRPTDDNSSETADDGPEAMDAVEVETERLRRSVSLEVFLAVTVLFLTAFLVALPRGKEALAASYRAPISATASLGGGRRVTVVADSDVHGPIQFTIAVDHGPRATIQATATQAVQQIGPLPIRLTRRSARTFEGSVALPVAGAWRIGLVVSTSPVDAVTTDLTLTLH